MQRLGLQIRPAEAEYAKYPGSHSIDTWEFKDLLISPKYVKNTKACVIYKGI